MSYISVLQGTPTWLPYIASNVNDGSPRIGITYGQIDVSYKKSTQSIFQIKTLQSSDFRENGNGVYEILFSGSELNTIGTFLYVGVGNGSLPLPVIRQYIGQVIVESSSSYVPGTITLNTNVLVGNLVDLRCSPLVGESVSARVLSSPLIMGISPNIGGISSNMITAMTDSSGFFALEVIQNSVVDIVIPAINYRRTLTVPENDSDKLFELP